MILLRIYNKKKKYPYFFHPEIKTYHEFVEYSLAHQDEKCELYDNADYAMVLSNEEQDSYWTNCIREIMMNTRAVLDNLDSIPEFKVRWNTYYAKDYTIGLPPKKLLEKCDKLYNHV